ncbi:MAG: nucleotidyltransferase domain-containing protein [Thermoplasmata archaeon]|nr:nucleotidyltransferase domain-containing protein [Thermoplasmata archaeon]
MTTLRTFAVPATFQRIWEKIGSRPFSPREVEELARKRGVANYVVLSRLTQGGWLLRLSRGRYLAAEPLVRMDSRLRTRLAPFRERCFYPILQGAVASILQVYAGQVIAIALFGSAARGTDSPESDLDLLVLVDRRTASPMDDARTRARIGRLSAGARMEEWETRRHFHQVQVVIAIPSDLDRPGPLFLDLSQDAHVLWDPSGVLARGLRRFAARLRSAGARRRHSSQLGTYWDLGRAFAEG